MKITLRSVALNAATLGALVAFASDAAPALAQGYPSKPITIVAASGPGGAIDVLSRILGRWMEENWKATVVIKNVAGAGGSVGAAQVKSADPDGYTLVTSNAGTFSDNWQQQAKATYNTGDFTYVNSFTGAGCAWVTKADSPYKTIQDVWAAAKAGKSVSFGAFSAGNKMYLDYVAKQVGVQIKAVSFKSVPEVLQAVLGGHVDFGFSGGSHAQHVQKGTLRTLVSTDDKPDPHAPSMPTLKSLYGISNCSFFMLAGPKGMPKDVTNKIADAMVRAMKTPEGKKFLESREASPLHYGPEEMTKKIHQDAGDFAKVLKAAKS